MRPIHAIAATGLVALAMTASPPPVLAAGSVTASQLEDALAPAGTSRPAEPQAGISMETRGIRLGGTKPVTGGMAAQAAARPASASLVIPFRPGSATISPDAAAVLDQLAVAMTGPRLAEFRFRIEGHTDTVGNPEANQTLSQLRADAVAAYLASKGGVAKTRLIPVGMGQDGLLIETGPGVAEPRNRRVLVVNLGR